MLKMNEKLKQLIKRASQIEMTSQDCEQQRLNFVYGNVKLSNPDVTMKMVETAARMKDYLSAPVCDKSDGYSRAELFEIVYSGRRPGAVHCWKCTEVFREFVRLELIGQK